MKTGSLINWKAILALCLLGLTTCTKQPTASFTTDKTEYFAGEMISLSNTSANADAYVWTFPNGKTSGQQDASFGLTDTARAGDYTFTLKATNKGKKSATASQTVKVKAVTGNLTAWTSNNSVGQITVQVDGVYAGTISNYYQFAPFCNAPGCVNTQLKVGVHTVTAVYASSSSSGTVNIKKNTCTVFELQ
jgi:hypothetical protein